ncbi:gamma-mobile-trio protein GmtX [Devosia sp. Root685]|uniref:gamma-mobile-trio protein GmtX n=1 Tax=Devosia sp. Root685 TaxID=1736587 RepID=UPI000AAA7754|nr:gamma-mobile-trio protein GmtX [Devosia sp. Root685]
MGKGDPNSDPLANPEWDDAKSFRDTLLDKTDRPNSINRIWEACLDLEKSGVKITVAEVGRVTVARWGSPKTQSIRDQPLKLTRLVELCAAAQRQGTANGPRGPRNESRIDSILAGVADQTDRAWLRQMSVECSDLKRENRALKKAFLKLAPLATSGGTRSDNTPGDEPMPTYQPILSGDERSQLARAADREFWYNEGYNVDAIHGLLTSSGRAILSASFFQGLQKVLGRHSMDHDLSSSESQ